VKSSLYPVQELRRRTFHWSVKLRVNPKVIRIQKMPRKWGSCSSTGTITLAEDLIDMDTQFQDFVIVHELLHLRYPTHGRLFKASMGAHIPGWQKLNLEQGSSNVANQVCEGQRRYCANQTNSVSDFHHRQKIK
jgi:predicted metal-dependent hydrolase